MTAWSTVLAAVVAGVTVGYAAPAHADDVRDSQRHLTELQVSEAHRHSVGDGVTVAVLDSGVDASHPDLRRNVLPGVDLTGRGSDGRDDPGGSGTALAGLIAGHGHTGPAATEDPGGQDGAGEGEDEAGSPSRAVGADGVLGLAPRAAVLPVVVSSPGAAPEASLLAAAVDEAVRRGVDVICIGYPVPDDPDLTRALGAAVAADVVVVAPAAPAGDALARYGEAGLLGAGPATDPPAATVGPGVVTVPADGAVSTGAQGGYYRYARTTWGAASAVLAGAAALVRSAHPQLPAYQLTNRMLATSRSGGELDLVAALTATVEPPPSPPAGPSGPASPAPPVAITEPADGAEPVAAFDSGDWRRWLIGAPLAAFLMLFVVASVAAARRVRRLPR